MRPSRRKAAEESQRRVRKLLDKDLEAIDDDIVLYEQVHDSDDDSEEKNARKVEKLTTGIVQNSKATYVNQRSKGKTTRRNFSIANTEHVLNQNEATESETDDSEYKPEDHSIENENIDISDGDEIMVISSDAEARRELKKINAPRRSRRTNHSDHSNENENINISDEDEIMINSTDADARNESRRIRASKRSKRTRKIRKTKSKKPGKRSCFGAGTVDLDWQVWEKELQGWEPWGNDGDIDLDALIQKKVPADVREPPPELLMPLLPFQKEWLAWGLKQEGSEFGGGILADEMGMGKTIQAIALILTSRALRQEQTIREKLSPALPNILGTSSTATKVLPQIKATLVVCPLVAVIQWRNEIARFTAEGSTKVLVYHGASRCRDLTELAQYDIVLTTYSIVELEHRKNLMPAKEKCQWCGRLFYPDRLVVHLRFFCGPTAVKSEKQAKQLKKKVKHMVSGKMSKTKPTDKGNVVEDDVCKIRMKGKPKSKGLVKDKGEISVLTSVTRRKRKAEALEVEGDISSCKSFKGKSKGQGRRKGEENMDAHFEDSSECTKEGLSPLGNIGSSFLHSVKWDRIILDEAHFIKDRRCSTSKAVFSLESSYKWALSGTPLQNRVGELYSLIRFLQIYPYSYYFCRRCDCKSLDYSFGKEWRKCDHCGHSPLHHFCWWNKFVANPIKKCGYMFEGRKAMILLKYKVLDSAVLRRTKSERAADLALPPRTAFLRRDTFDAREEDFYQALYTRSQSQFNTYITAGTLLNNYAHIFDLLTRLRQAVDHPYLVVYSGTSASPLDQNNTFDLPSAKEVCGICHDPPEDSVSAGCGHIFCRVCIQEHASTAGQSLCPSCSKPLTVDLTIRKNSNSQQSGIKVNGYRRSSIINRINIENFQTSTKIDALREEIMLMLQKDAAAKAIVFSQFTSFLDLIRFCLQKSGMKCAQLVGNMSIQARDQTIEKFTNDPDCKVFLMSLKAGGVALNLTVASHVFLMDPWWNPAVEQQAQDRIHRIGQYKPIRVVRFVIANTIEERILRLQEKKQLVFEGTVGGSSEALGRLTEDDLRFLFTN